MRNLRTSQGPSQTPMYVKSNWLASWLAKFIQGDDSTRTPYTSQWTSQTSTLFNVNWLASWLAKCIKWDESTSNRWPSQRPSQAPHWRQIILTWLLTCRFHQWGMIQQTLTARVQLTSQAYMVCFVRLCYIMLCCATLCYAMLRYVMVCYVIMLWNNCNVVLLALPLNYNKHNKHTAHICLCAYLFVCFGTCLSEWVCVCLCVRVCLVVWLRACVVVCVFV